MPSDPNAPNPYTAPLQSPIGNLTPTEIQHQKLIKDFRSQSLASGVLWLIFAVLGGINAATLLTAEEGALPLVFLRIAGGITIVLAVGWAISGVGTLMRSPWGLYIGLVTTYLALVISILTFNICGLIFLIVIVIQAHRVLGFMGQMRRLGIPLDTKA